MLESKIAFMVRTVALLRNGTTKAFVADRYGMSQVNLYNWLNKSNIDVKQKNIDITAKIFVCKN